MIKLSLKVEALNKYGGFTTNQVKEGFIKNLTSRNPSGAKTTLKPQVKSEVHKPQQESTPKSRQCFKCHGVGHIASECPNRRVVSLVEEDEAEEEDVEGDELRMNLHESDHGDKDELTASSLLLCLILFPSVGITVVQHCSTVGIHRSFPQGVV